MAGLNDFVVFNDFAQRAFTEVMDQQVQLWNGATRNALVMASGNNIGDFMEASQYQMIADLVGNRNAYSTASMSATNLAQLLEVSVKVGGGTKPVEYTGTSFDWTRRPASEAGAVFGEQMAQGAMQYKLNSALAVLTAAINGADVTFDGTASNASLESLNKGAAKFGDRASALQCWIMHSKSQHDIYGQSLQNSNRLFEFGTIRVIEDGFGRPLVQTDSDALHFDNAGTENYHQLGLVSGACVVEDNNDVRTYEETKVEFENAKQIVKGEFSFNVGVKGYAWDKASGGKSPNDVALATTANWDKNATSHKDTAGVKVTTL